MSRKWTKEEEAYLIRRYEKGMMDPKGMYNDAFVLSRSVNAVRARAVKLGLVPPKKASGRRRGRGSGIQTVVDGQTFDSKIEAGYYQEMLLREKAGEIQNLRLQVRYGLWAAGDNGHKIKVGVYIADFVFEEKTEDGWEEVVVDVKAARQYTKAGRLKPDRATPTFKLKQKIWTANQGRELRIVRR